MIVNSFAQIHTFMMMLGIGIISCTYRIVLCTETRAHVQHVNVSGYFCSCPCPSFERMLHVSQVTSAVPLVTHLLHRL